MWRDLRFALRMIRKTPAYSAIAVLTLALGIGATTAIFSVVNGVLLRPLPYKDPGRLVYLWEGSAAFPEMLTAYPDLLDWQQQSQTMDIAAFRGESYNLTGGERAERLDGRMYSAGLLPLLGVQPLLGRNFTEADDKLEAAPVVILSNKFWLSHFNRDPQILGKSLTLGGVPYTVIGVLPESFHFDKGEIMVPLGRLPMSSRMRGNHPGIETLGRIRPGFTLDQARSDLESIGRALGAQYQQNKGVMPAIAPLQARLVKDLRVTLLLLLGAVAFVLLIAVANVANLTLARGTARRREMAVRAALGAGRLQLIRQVLVESALVSLIGGALGVVIALWGVDLLASARPDSMPVDLVINVDLKVLLFSLLISLGAGILFGLAPALSVSKTDLNQSLKDGDRHATSQAHHRTRSVLVVTEVALALILLIGAGLTTKAFVALSRSDTGFRSTGVLTAQVPIAKGKFTSAPELQAFFDRLTTRLQATPGIDSVAIARGIPLENYSETGVAVEGQPLPKSAADVIMAVYYSTDESYLQAMGVPLIAGRFLKDSDTMATQQVVVVDDVFAKQFFPAGDVLGKHLVDKDGKLQEEIVGVVKHVVNYGVGEIEQARYQIYYPYRQLKPADFLSFMTDVNLVVRAGGLAPGTLAATVAAQVAAVDPEQPIFDVKPMSTLVEESLAARRFAMMLLGVFAALAMVLAAIGLYSVMSYAVAQRTHEIGVRMALGARPRDVQRMVIGQGLKLTAIGLAIGIVGAIGLTRLMSSMIVGVKPTDPATFALVALLLGAASALASFIPARRATRVDPMIALRHD